MQMLMHSLICSPESFRGDADQFLFVVNLLPGGITPKAFGAPVMPPEPQNLTVTSLEQVWVPASHTM
jgi:hypothetical protein